MKILKRRPWGHKFTCRGCKSELEAEPSDVRLGRFGGGYCESGDLKYYVTCAVCGTDHTIADSKVPQDVQNGAKRDKD